MPRVLHLINTAGPGGAETVYLNLISGLAAREWTSLPIVGWDNDWLPAQLRNRGFEPVIAASTSRYDFRYLRRLARLVRDHSVDLIHAHLFGPAVEASIVGRLARVPVVGTIHGRGDLRADERLKGLKFALLNRGLARAVFVSDSLREHYLNQGPLRRDITTVIPNGVEFTTAHPITDSSPLPEWVSEETFVVAAVGNLREVKRYDVLIRAAALLKERGCVVQFVIAGEGPEWLLQELLQLAAELRVEDCVHFLGFVEDVDAILRNADLFALASDSEGFSIATVQAMAHGLPVVVSRCGGPEEIVDEDRTGRLFDPGAADQLAELIAQLQMDPDERQRLGRAAREDAESRFALDRQVQQYEDLYRELLTDGRRASL